MSQESSGPFSSWLELESDPGLFTLLLEHLGVNGLQVDMIYDLDGLTSQFEQSDCQQQCNSLCNSPDDIFGFIFLFKWGGARRTQKRLESELRDRYVTDESRVNSLFFAHQLVENSCATLSLLHVILNQSPGRLETGPLLSEFRDYTAGMSPESKGLAIASHPKLWAIHNGLGRVNREQSLLERLETTGRASSSASRATDSDVEVVRFQSSRSKQPTSSSTSASSSHAATSESDTYHFVSFVPVGGRLLELDGLRPHAVDHGPITGTHRSWVHLFAQVIGARMALSGRNNTGLHNMILALVPDRIAALHRRLAILRANDDIFKSVIGAIQRKQPTPTPVKFEFKTESKQSIKSEPETDHSSANSSNASPPLALPPATLLTTSASCNAFLQSSDSRRQPDATVKTEHLTNGISSAAVADADESSRALLDPLISRLASCSGGVLPYSADELREQVSALQNERKRSEQALTELVSERDAFRRDNLRRTHHYNQLVIRFVQLLVRCGRLGAFLRRRLPNLDELVATRIAQSQEHPNTNQHAAPANNGPASASNKSGSSRANNGARGRKQSTCAPAPAPIDAAPPARRSARRTGKCTPPIPFPAPVPASLPVQAPVPVPVPAQASVPARVEPPAATPNASGSAQAKSASAASDAPSDGDESSSDAGSDAEDSDASVSSSESSSDSSSSWSGSHPVHTRSSPRKRQPATSRPPAAKRSRQTYA